jgi:hypothetical protein
MRTTVSSWPLLAATIIAIAPVAAVAQTPFDLRLTAATHRIWHPETGQPTALVGWSVRLLRSRRAPGETLHAGTVLVMEEAGRRPGARPGCHRG